MRITGPKCRLCRREKKKLFLKGEKCFSTKCPVARKPYAPGQHGLAKARAKISEYGRQLSAARQVRRIYDITEKTLRRVYNKSGRMNGIHSEDMIRILETRLDTVLLRSGLVASRPAARQASSHGHFMLNGRRVDVPSIQVKVGDVIELAPRFESSPLYKESANTESHVEWIKVTNGKIEVIALPTAEDIESLGLDAQTIIEFYSR